MRDCKDFFGENEGNESAVVDFYCFSSKKKQPNIILIMNFSCLIREPIVAHRGERGNYNARIGTVSSHCIVAHRGERGNYNQ